MRNRFPRRGRRFAPTAEQTKQPGIPAGEARLVHVREESGSVFLALDDGSTLELAPESVPTGLPPAGEIIPPALLADIWLAAERKQVARLVFALLDRRLLPVAGIRDKAVEKGYSKEAVEAVLEQLASRGLYSDRHFAEAYCRDCLASRAVGRRYLVDKLRSKRVPAALAAEVASEILDADTEEALAERAAATRWKRMKVTGNLKALATVVRFLLGRGFDPGVSNRVARKTEPPGNRD